jgi:hypothetical protein
MFLTPNLRSVGLANHAVNSPSLHQQSREQDTATNERNPNQVVGVKGKPSFPVFMKMQHATVLLFNVSDRLLHCQI